MNDIDASSSMATPAEPDPMGATPQNSWGLPPTGRRDIFLRLALVTAGYFAASLAGKLLVLDPGHASPLWPASGLALAALLIWGSRLWPGVWLGAFLYSFSLNPSVAVMPLAAAVASGATLAALLGARLTRRFCLPALPLTKELDLWRFLLLAGPLPCLISATVAVTSLHLGGWMSTDEIVSQWLLWWVGDSLGVILFSPVLLTFYPGTRRFLSRVTLNLSVIALLVIAAHQGLDRLEQHQALTAADDRMNETCELGFHHLSDHIRGLTNLERFFAASEEVTSQEFATFTADIIRHPTILAVDWAPRVTGNERPAFEADLRQKGGPSHILEVNANGQAVTAGERSEYFPILFSAARASLRPVLGHDHGFQEERRLAMARACDTGTMVTTRLISQQRTDHDALMLFTPVYRQDFAAGDAMLEERRLALRGFIVGLYEVKALFADLTQAAAATGLLFRVTDISPGEPARVLTSTLPAATTPAWRITKDFTNRSWQLELQPATAVWQDSASILSRLYLGCSLLISLLVASAALGAAGRNALVTISEARWRTFAENVPGAVYICTLSPPWRMTFMSKLVREITGWTAEDFLATRVQWSAIVLPEDLSRVEEEVARAIAERTSFAMEYRILHRDGSKRWVHEVGRAVFDANGHALHLEGNIFDITHLKATEHALQSSEQFIHAILDSLSAHVAVLDADGRISTTNQAWRNFAEANGCDWQSVSEGANYLAVCDQAALQGDKDATSVAQGIRDILGGQQGTWFHEYPCHSPSEQRWFYCTLSQFTINDACYVVMVHANITLMHQAQTALQESQERYRRLIENLGSEYFFYSHDSSGRMQYASPSVQQILGYPAEAFRGHYSEYLMDSPENQVVAVNTDLVLHSSSQSTYTLLARCQNGSGRWLELTEFPLRDAAGQVIGVEGIAHDIHQRKLDEFALRQLAEELESKVEERTSALTAANILLFEQDEKLHATLDNLLDCVITINEQGIIQSANKAVRQVLGYTPEELIGHNVSQLPAQPHGRNHDAYIARYLREGNPHIIGIGREVEGRHRDGRLIPLELSISEFTSHGQRFFTGILRDISERKRFITELTESREAAEQANRAKSIFLATMSHEIRTPMNGVIGMVEVLEQSTLNTFQVDMVRTIRDSAINLLGLIDDILDFSKAEAGRLEMEQVEVALVDLIEDLCQSLVPMVIAKGIHFDLFIDPEVPELVIGDGLRLRQVFYNLLGNAIKFADPGQTKRPGRIALRVEVAQARPLQLVIRISDNGIGMTPETVAQLFTPFSQGEMSTTRRFGGTGLGLTICQRLVTLMGGDIAIESLPDKGTTFTVTLPVTAPEEQPRRLCPDLSEIDCLLVDSPYLDRAGLAAYLEYAGAHVVATPPVSSKFPLVVILDGGDGMIPRETLLAPFAALPNMRAVLLLTRGKRRQARQETSGMVTLDGVVMRRKSFVQAVALAAGRNIPDPLPQQNDQKTTFDHGAALPSIDESIAQGRLILVAEDDEINQKVILQQLALLGQRAEVADNGVEALDMWRGGEYGLLLTDLHMPEMDGYTLAETIRREESGGRRIPILALTANASQGEVHRTRAVGMDEYLTKPIRLQTLWATIKKWLPQTDEPPLPVPLSEPLKGETTAAAVDITVLQGLVGDDADTVREFIVDYLASAQCLGAELGAAAAAGDGAQVKAIAHKLKSSSRTVGAATLAELCASLENAGQTGNQEAIHHGRAEFEIALKAVEEECRAWLTKHEKEK